MQFIQHQISKGDTEMDRNTSAWRRGHAERTKENFPKLFSFVIIV